MQSFATIECHYKAPHSTALCGHGNFTMNGAKTARVARNGLDLTKTERRRRRPRLMRSPVFTLNCGYYRRWRLETGEIRLIH